VRAAYLVEAAKRMRERRHFFSAWMTLEAGKSWGEADADTAAWAGAPDSDATASRPSKAVGQRWGRFMGSS
jgi:acyl-CoA reductase-like NAD-dependent aldehyde dehydrogenase